MVSKLYMLHFISFAFSRVLCVLNLDRFSLWHICLDLLLTLYINNLLYPPILKASETLYGIMQSYDLRS